MRTALLCVTLACTSTGNASRPQARPEGLPALDSAGLVNTVARLAHDSMAGRAAMTAENARARAWLSSEFERIGLMRVGTEWSHPFARARPNRPDSVRGANVLGLVRGTVRPDRVIVVGAHYDHLGTRNGEIHNGADDNASGTAAVLAMAAHFSTNSPQHSILFALWDAEEVGLAGARAFVAQPPASIPLSSIVANVNLDMVSRNDRGELWAAGASHYPAMKTLLDSLARIAPLTLRLGHDSGGGQNDWTTQSDHAAFHAAGIPFVYFGVEDHPDYHRPTDDFERIQPGFYLRAARTIAAFVELLDRLPSGSRLDRSDPASR
ncbi:MAG: M28 family peptidase [Gemmatimonadota bacterium]